jgi:replicative DNA helicase
MYEFWRWLTGSGILAAFLWMAGKFWNKNVEQAIADAKLTAKEATNLAHSVSERVSSALFEVSKSQTILSSTVITEMTNMRSEQKEILNEANKARLEAHDAQQSVQVFVKAADETVKKFAQGGIKLNEKIEVTRTEVKELNKELLLIKNKKGNQ